MKNPKNQHSQSRHIPQKKNNRSFNDPESTKQQQLFKENDHLRSELVKISEQLDQMLEKAAALKLKVTISPVIASSQESKEMQLQNALKRIDRLKKTIRDYESKQAYEVSYRKIIDLEAIINKKDIEIEELKAELKRQTKNLREKERTVKEMLQQQDVVVNVNVNKEKIEQLKDKIKKINIENSDLLKKGLEKEERLFLAQRKMQQLQWEEDKEIGRSQQLLEELERSKNQYKKTMLQVEKQNAEIIKLNLQISEQQKSSRKRRAPKSHSFQESPRKISMSMDQLPQTSRKKAPSQLTPLLPSLSKRY